MKRCDQCVFWERSGKSEEGPCRRYPPQVHWAGEDHVDDFGTSWPYTDEDDWCGEFRERVE